MLFREYLQNKGVKEADFDVAIAEEKAVLDRISNVRGLRKSGEARHSLKGKIVKQEHYLNYTDLCDLGEIVDIFHAKENAKKQKKPTPKKYQQPLISDAQEINPVRNPVMHTNEITDVVLAWSKIKNPL